jgi:two-component system, OmpR family, response regulator
MTDTSSRLLIVDDDQEICSLISLYFEKHGFDVIPAHSAAQMRHELARETIDLVLLDIMLPDASGLDLCREIRQSTDIPVIMLTAVSDLADRVAGLEIGADDYVAKPFEPRELLARVRAVIRRRSQAQPSEQQRAAESYRLDGWTLDVDRRRFVSPDDVLISLTYAEFELLTILARNANRPLSRGHILELVSGIGSDVYDRSVDVLVSRLRKKLENASCTLNITSIRNVGYALQAPVQRQ